jgi:carboxyl-terminal processing protease
MKKKILLPVLALVLSVSFLSFQKDFFEIAKQLEIFTTFYKDINMNYVDETVPAELMENAIKGMLEGLDPYTNYYNEQDVETSRINATASYSGIGATVKGHPQKLTVMEVWKDGAADKGGLKAGDEITKIDDVVISTFQEDAGALLNGAAGTSFQVTFKRQGKTQTTTLTREASEERAVPFYQLIDGNTGYIVLSAFNRKTTSETRYALQDLKRQGAEKIILDLRGNPGGILGEAVNIVNLFVPKGEVITTTKSAIQKYNNIYRTSNEPVDTEIPLVVLINGRSASASEIVSGAVQDLDRGVVIGARSFGKGLVQRPKPLAYGTQMKITISKYYTPSGRCIQAEDYFNRDENGDPIRATPETYNAFKTRGGRTVYDGGGILPDIEMPSAAYSPITTAILKHDAIFNFATEYYYKNRYDTIEDFQFTDKDFQDFIAYLKKSDFQYETETEAALKTMLKKAEDEKLKDGIQKSYQALLADIQKTKDGALQDKKPEIVSLLTDEIVKRYFYRDGLYQYHIKHNPEIKEALAVLNDKKRYNAILK